MPTTRRLAWTVGANMALALLYFVFGKLALLQAVPPGIATLIFFPSGIALAAVVSYGPRLLPGVAAGALLMNLDAGLAAPLVLSLGSTMQAAVAARLFRRWSHAALATAPAILAFLLLVPSACLIAPTVAVAGLLQLGVLQASQAGVTWVFWWAGDTIGMLVAAPLCWLLVGQPRSLWRRRVWLIALPLCLSGGAFIAIFEKVSTLELQQRRHALALQAQQLADVFEHQFSEHDRLMFAMGSLYRPSLVSTPEQFERVARSTLDRRPELRLISWAPYVDGRARAAFERWGQAGIAADYTVRQIGADGGLAAAAVRAKYFPTAFIAPLAGNEAVLGLDMLSEPLRAAMVREASERARPVASAPITLVQQAGARAILLAQGVRTEGQAAPEGVLVAVIDVGRAIALARAQDGLAALVVRLEDVSSPFNPQLLADFSAPGAAAPQIRRTLAMGGRNYQLTVAPDAALAAASQGWQSWGALGVGMVLTGLLGAFLLLVSGQREQIEALVVQRTAALAEREARLQAILDQAADAILTVGNDGAVLSANGAAERLFGAAAAALAGLPFTELVPLARLDGGRAGGAELAGVRRDGARFPVALAASRVDLPGAQLWVCIVRDLTEQQRAQQQILALEALKQTQNEMRTAEKMAALGSLVAGVAHELNTPVGNSLLAATALTSQVNAFQEMVAAGAVRRSTLDAHLADTARGCELIAGSLHRVADLISSFKQVAIDQTIDQRSDFALDGVVEAALAGKSAALAAAGCYAQRDVAPGLRLHSYPASIAQVLHSLVNNALLHAFAGRSNGHVTITARALDAQWVELVFADDGVGMAPEVLARVFDPFFTTKLGQGSSGLGMNIVYNLVTGMLGGRIALASTPGLGTSVTMTLPVDAPARSGATHAPVAAALSE